MFRTIRKDITCAALCAVLVGGCTTTQGAQAPLDPTTAIFGGAVAGGALGALSCKVLGKDNCGKFALGGAVVGAVAGYVLSRRQQQIYDAAQKSGIKTETREYINSAGEKKADVFLEDEFFEDGSSQLSDSGKQKLDHVLYAGQDSAQNESIEFGISYNPDSRVSRLLAEKKAEELRKNYHDIPNSSFRIVSVEGGGDNQLIIHKLP